MVRLVEAEHRDLRGPQDSDNLSGLLLFEPVGGSDGVGVGFRLFLLFGFLLSGGLFLFHASAESGQQRLVGCDRQVAGFTDESGDDAVIFLLQEGGADALPPLVFDGVGGAEYQGRTLQPRDDFDTEGGLPRAGGGHHVEFLVTHVIVKVVQDSLLVASPGSVEVQCPIMRLCHEILFVKR